MLGRIQHKEWGYDGAAGARYEGEGDRVHLALACTCPTRHLRMGLALLEYLREAQQQPHGNGIEAWHGDQRYLRRARVSRPRAA